MAKPTSGSLRPIAELGWFAVPIVLGTLLVSCGAGESRSAGTHDQLERSHVDLSLTGGLSTASLSVQVDQQSCNPYQAQHFFRVINGGTTAVQLSDVQIKYWVYDTSGSGIASAVYFGGYVDNVNGNPSVVHQVAGVTSAPTAFAHSCGSAASHQANFEVTVQREMKAAAVLAALRAAAA